MCTFGCIMSNGDHLQQLRLLMGITYVQVLKVPHVNPLTWQLSLTGG
jgi:hypothetical protein